VSRAQLAVAHDGFGAYLNLVARVALDREAMIILGSQSLGSALRDADLIDEYRIVVHPFLVSTGPRLFGDEGPRLDLKVAEAKPFSSGSIAIRYVRVRPEQGD